MSQKFSEDEIAVFKEAFDFHDLNHDGKIHVSLITTVMICLGHNVMEIQVEEFLRDVVVKKDQVDFANFVKIMENNDTKKETKEEVLEAFEAFDCYDKKFMSDTDLRRMVDLFGAHGNMNNLDVDDMVQHADPRGTKRIYYKELVDEMI